MTRARAVAAAVCCAVAASFAMAETAPARDAPALELTQEEQDWLAQHPTIRIGPAPNFPPVEFLDDANEHRGMTAEYAALLESLIGVQFEVKAYPSWNDVVDATKNGEVDVWLEATQTAERMEYMLFTQPYIELSSVIVARRELEGSLAIEDLKGLRILAIEGYATRDFLRERYPDLELHDVSDIKTGLEKVSFGSADAIIVNVATASYYIESQALTNLRVAGVSGYSWKLSVASRKDWPLLHQVLEKALAAISDEEHRAIRRRWVGLDAPSGSGFSVPVVSAVVLAALSALVGWYLFRRRRRGPRESAGGARLAEAWPIYLTVTLVIAAIVAISIWNHARVDARVRKDIGNSIETVLNTTSNAAFDWMRRNDIAVRSLSRQAEIRRALARLAVTLEHDGPVEIASAQDDMRQVLDMWIEGSEYERVVLLSAAGDLLALSGNQASLAEASLGLLSRVAGQTVEDPNGAAIRLPERSEAGATSDAIRESFLFGGVVHGGQGNPAYVMVLVVSPGEMFTEILRRGRIGDSGESYAFNAHGQMISESRFTADLRQLGLLSEGQGSILNVELRDPGGNLLTGFRPAMGREEQPFTAMAASALSGGSARNLDGYRDYRGVPVIGAWTWDRESGLGITTEIDVDEAYAFLKNYTQQTVVSTSIAIFLVLGLTALFINNRVRMAEVNAQLEKAYQITKLHKDRMETELNVGRDIQMSMIPAIMPDREEFSLHAILKPAREVGGDFYDFFFIDDHHLCFCVGDVSGKGVPAALFMAVSKTVIKSRSANDFSPASILTHTNDELSADNPNNMFVTLLLAILDLRTGSLVYCNAGHNPPLIRRASGEVTLLTDRHGRIAGAMGGMSYKESVERLERGDLIVLYTDGVTEALNARNELLGDDRLVALLESSSDAGAEEIVDKIVTAVHEFEAGTEQTDDVTVLALRFDAETALSGTDYKIMARNDLSEIPRVTEEIDRFCKARGVDQSVNGKVNVVIDDHLNNVISYAFDDDAAHEIEVDLTLRDDGLTVRVSDNGVAFDPLAAPPPDMSTNLQDRPIGGLGLELIRTLPDEIDYARQDGRNVVTVVFYLSRAEAVSQET